MGDPITGLIIGSCVFLFVGIVAYCIIDNYVKKSFQSNAPKLNSERTLYYENRGTVIVSVIIAIIGMWMMWAACYMHQMYPLISPIPHSH